ncbi:MAG: DUF4397 domain-containing protein [Rhodothermales bacterium]
MSNFYSASRGALAALSVALLFFAATPAWAQTFTADLAGANEVPPVDTDASGAVEAVLDGLSLTVSGSFEGLETDFNTAVGAHIHRGAADANGPVIFPLDPTLDGDNRGGTFEPGNNSFTLTQAQADDLAAGLYYVNVHSVGNPSGEVRGQLLEAAGGARLQVIHNAADPGAAVVDVYVEEVSTEEPFIDDFAFRTATPYVTVPAGVALTVTVAPGNSNNADDGLASFEYTLEEGETYQLIANGVLDPSQFEANPSGEPIAFTLFVNGAGQEDSDTAGEIQLNVVHGATDAPAVDVIARDVATLVDGATYGDLTGYIGVPEGRYLLDVTPDEANDVIVATFEADLRGAAGAALTVLASGFLSPDNDQNGEAFGLLAVFADGTTALLPQLTDARVQVIHNAADPAAAVVDIYIEEVSTDEPAIGDLAFRAATPFIDLPANTTLSITVAPGDSDSADDGLATFPVVLLPGATYSVIANGVLDPSQFEANPSGEPIAFTLFVDDDAQEASTEEDEVQFSVVHGATDAPTVDVIARDVATLVDDATYGDITDYIGVPAGAYTLDVTLADGTTVAATFAADLSGAAGVALTVLASGFLSPENDQNGPAFGLLAVFPDGTTALLPIGAVSNEDGAVSPTAFTLRGAYPNPVQAATTVQFDLGTDARVSVEVFDVLGRRVLQTAPALKAAGTAQEVRIDAGSLPSGAYLYRLTAETAADTLVQSGRLTVIR